MLNENSGIEKYWYELSAIIGAMIPVDAIKSPASPAINVTATGSDM